MWKQHYSGVIAWVQCRRPDLGAIDPFLTTLLSMIASQCVLHMRGAFRQQSYRLLEALSPFWGQLDASGEHAAVVDAVLGCSVDLPRLIVEAGHLEDELRQARAAGDAGLVAAACLRAERLQDRIRSTRLAAPTLPRLRLLGGTSRAPSSDLATPSNNGDGDLVLADPFADVDTREAARAAAEMFRHALHVFVFRTFHDDPMTTTATAGVSNHRPPRVLEEAIAEAFELLPCIPDTSGPGSFLGWSMVVIGAEVDRADQREYIKRRLESLTRLCLNHGVLPLKVLDEVWRRRDMTRMGSGPASRKCRWQEVMDDLEVDIALI